MTNQDSNSDTQGQRPKTYGLAKLSMWLSILGAGLFFAGCLHPAGLAGFVFAFILGIVALIRIKRSDGVLRGNRFAIAGISISVVFLVLCMLWFGIFLSRVRTDARRLVCAERLRELQKAILNYSDDFDGKYPTANEWCDLLVEHKYISEDSRVFQCPGARIMGNNARCHYAINPNCEPNSPGDVMLLFETKGGWNQFGGAEMRSFKNHKGKGCNVLFNDGHVKFVPPEWSMELKWEKDGVSNIEQGNPSKK